MKIDHRNFRLEAVLEAPLWLMMAGVVLVTIAVISTAIAAF